tara:strand:+ start:15511 stop:16626 length:1116 start_codon:yes stop_codon:yes gene_type:complete
MLSANVNSVSIYKTNIFKDLGVTIETAIKRHCTGTTQGVSIETNLPNLILPIGNIYHVDLGLGDGIRYYEITYSDNHVSDDGIDIDILPNFGQPILDICNSLSWKYHRVILLGSTLQEAKDNFCSNTTVNTTREKVNIKIESPLINNSIYLMDFGLGTKYYKIDTSSVEKGDSDYDLDTTNNTVVFSKTILNCPISDSDGDGVPNSSDNCPNEAGPSSNNGCPTFADLIIDTSLSTAKSSGASGTTQSLSSNIFHALYLGENLQVLLFVKNVGEANSSTMKVGFYVTQGSSFSNATLLKEVNYNGIITPNQSQSMSTEISGSSIAGYANSNGWAYIHVRVDKDDSIDEGTSGGEDNNIYSSIPVVTYYTPR